MTQKWAITFYILFQSLNASRNFHSYGDFRAACNLKPNSNGSILKSLIQDSLFSTRCFALFERPAGPNPPAVIFVGELPPPTQWRRGCCSCTAEMRGKCVLKNIKIFIIKIFVFPSVDKSSLCCVQLISYLSSPRHVVPYRATCHLFSIILQAKASSC